MDIQMVLSQYPFEIGATLCVLVLILCSYG